jgi:hypothetical protein
MLLTSDDNQYIRAMFDLHKKKYLPLLEYNNRKNNLGA